MVLPSISMHFPKGAPRTKITGNKNQQTTVYYEQCDYFIAAACVTTISNQKRSPFANANRKSASSRTQNCNASFSCFSWVTYFWVRQFCLLLRLRLSSLTKFCKFPWASILAGWGGGRGGRISNYPPPPALFDMFNEILFLGYLKT